MYLDTCAFMCGIIVVSVHAIVEVLRPASFLEKTNTCLSFSSILYCEGLQENVHAWGHVQCRAGHFEFIYADVVHSHDGSCSN